jgi:lysophospholipase L1-like esterase
MLGAGYDTAFTLYVVVKKPTIADTLIYLSAAGGNLYLGQYSHGGVDWYTSGISNIQGHGTGSHTEILVTCRYDGAQKMLGVNGAAQLVAATGNLGLTGAVTVGDYSAGGFGWTSGLRAVLLYQAVNSYAEMRQVEVYLGSRYGLVVTHWNYIFDGDSLTFGYASTAGNDYPSLVMALLGSNPYHLKTNDGLNGDTLANMAAAAPAGIDLLYDPHQYKNVVCIWGGTNDLFAGASAATVYGNIVDYGTGRRAVGFQVVVFTITPRNNFDAGMEANRLTINTNIRTNWATFADALVDVAADGRIGDAGDEDNLTYYDADGTHLNDTGYAIVAGLAYAQIAAL